jgi:DNA-binding NarL/FixJ family response regulator
VEGTERLPAPARVVFADDDAVFRELLRGLLGFLPHVTVVGEAGDGVEAVRLVAQHYPDTVLLDVDMPRLDGFGAAEVIRSFRPRTRLMLHTGAPDEEKRRRAKALGVSLLDKLQLNATTTSSRSMRSQTSIRSRATSSRWFCSRWRVARRRACSS